jgi:hypothetical protein
MADRSIERQETASPQAEGPAGRPDLDVASDHMQGESAFCLVFRHPRVASNRDQHHSEVFLLDQRSGVMPRTPGGLRFQSMKLTLQIELHERFRHGRSVWTAMRLMLGLVRHASLLSLDSSVISDQERA